MKVEICVSELAYKNIIIDFAHLQHDNIFFLSQNDLLFKHLTNQSQSIKNYNHKIIVEVKDKLAKQINTKVATYLHQIYKNNMFREIEYLLKQDNNIQQSIRIYLEKYQISLDYEDTAKREFSRFQKKKNKKCSFFQKSCPPTFPKNTPELDTYLKKLKPYFTTKTGQIQVHKKKQIEILYYIEIKHLPIHEVSEVLKITSKSVRLNLHKIRHELARNNIINVFSNTPQ